MNEKTENQSLISGDAAPDLTSDPFSEGELQEIRNRTFNAELSGLINKISGGNEDDESVLQEVESSSADPLKRINRIIYEQYARRTGGNSIQKNEALDDSIAVLEYELQLLGIDHYALFYYSEEDECFKAYHSVFVDVQYIGIYRKELVQAVTGTWTSFEGGILISLTSLLNNWGEGEYSNTLLPLILLECASWDGSVYERLRSSSLPAVLMAHEHMKDVEEKRKKLIRHTVHTELVRLQHSYTLIPESVCYVFCTLHEKNLETLGLFRSHIDMIRTELSHQSSVYMFNGITAVLFLHNRDVNLLHNLYLKIHEKNRSLVLLDLEDFRGRNFLSMVYSAACGQFTKE